MTHVWEMRVRLADMQRINKLGSGEIPDRKLGAPRLRGGERVRKGPPSIQLATVRYFIGRRV